MSCKSQDARVRERWDLEVNLFSAPTPTFHQAQPSTGTTRGLFPKSPSLRGLINSFTTSQRTVFHLPIWHRMNSHASNFSAAVRQFLIPQNNFPLPNNVSQPHNNFEFTLTVYQLRWCFVTSNLISHRITQLPTNCSFRPCPYHSSDRESLGRKAESKFCELRARKLGG